MGTAADERRCPAQSPKILAPSLLRAVPVGAGRQALARFRFQFQEPRRPVSVPGMFLWLPGRVRRAPASGAVAHAALFFPYNGRPARPP